MMDHKEQHELNYLVSRLRAAVKGFHSDYNRDNHLIWWRTNLAHEMVRLKFVTHCADES